jgi:tetratricopeptide (TPR) repeat protein
VAFLLLNLMEVSKRSLLPMQDVNIRPRTSQFPIIENLPPQNQPFEVIPENPENRKKALFDFDRESQEQIVTEKSGTEFATLVANAETLVRHNEKELAKALIYKALAIQPQNPTAIRLAAKVLHPVTDLTGLAVIHENLCLIDYGFESVADLAGIYYRQGDDKKAMEKYMECLGLVTSDSPQLFDVYKNIGNILTREKDFEGAEEYYHRAFALNPDSDVLLVNLGTLELQQNEHNDAIDRFRQAIKINPRNDKAWVGLALVHNSLGDSALAFGNIEEALDINPANRTAVHVYSNWCSRDGKYVNAIEKLQVYLSGIELDEDMSLLLIHLLCQINRFDMARLEVERVLLWNPDSLKMAEIEKSILQMAEGMK